MTRGRLWLRVGLLLAVVSGVIAGVVIGLARDSGWVQVGALDEMNDPTFVSEHDVFVVPSEHGVRALSALNPHAAFEGEPVFYCPTGYFQGPHGEMFDLAGRYIGGPAPRGMDRFPVRVRYGLVEVEIDAPIPGPPRHDRGSLPPGRFCVDPLVQVRPGVLRKP